MDALAKTACPTCGVGVNYDPAQAGRLAACKRCGEKMRLPELKVVTPAPHPEAKEKPVRPKPAPNHERPSRRKAIVLAVVAVACLLSAGLAGFYVWNDARRLEASDATVHRAKFMSMGLNLRHLDRTYEFETQLDFRSEYRKSPKHLDLATIDTEERKLNALLNSRFGNKDPRMSDYSLTRSTRFAELDGVTMNWADLEVRRFKLECSRLQDAYNRKEITASQFYNMADVKFLEVWNAILARHEQDAKEVLSLPR